MNAAHFTRASLVGLILTACSGPLAAQLAYTTAGETLTETFTRASGWGTGNAAVARWTDNTTVRGWYAAFYENETATYTTPTSYVQSNGAQSSRQSLYLFRDTTNATTRQDGALGAFPINAQTGGAASKGGVFFGVQIANQTGQTLTQFSLTYVMEIWRLSNRARANRLIVSYRIGGSEFAGGEWTPIPELTLTSPTGPAENSAPQNGNLPENRIAAPVTTVSGVSIPSGESLWIRWWDANDPGIDNGLGIDDVAFSARP